MEKSCQRGDKDGHQYPAEDFMPFRVEPGATVAGVRLPNLFNVELDDWNKEVEAVPEPAIPAVAIWIPKDHFSLAENKGAHRNGDRAP